MSLQEVADTQAIFTLLAADGLEVRGMVDFPTVWTGEQISEMGMIDVRFLNSSVEETVYRGAPLLGRSGRSGIYPRNQN